MANHRNNIGLLLIVTLLASLALTTNCQPPMTTDAIPMPLLKPSKVFNLALYFLNIFSTTTLPSEPPMVDEFVPSPPKVFEAPELPSLEPTPQDTLEVPPPSLQVARATPTPSPPSLQVARAPPEPEEATPIYTNPAPPTLSPPPEDGNEAQLVPILSDTPPPSPLEDDTLLPPTED